MLHGSPGLIIIDVSRTRFYRLSIMDPGCAKLVVRLSVCPASNVANRLPQSLVLALHVWYASTLLTGCNR